VGLLVATVEMPVLNRFFTTTDLSSGQWLACAAVGSTILWLGELLKVVLRARQRLRRDRPTPRRPTAPRLW